MERKYYLRGLGLGIAMTAIIMGVALPESRAMTNDEIIARAKELGLVENTVLSDVGNAEDSQEDLVDEHADEQVQDLPGQSLDDLAAANSDIDLDPRVDDAEAEESGHEPDEAEGETVPEEDNEGQEDDDWKDTGLGNADSEIAADEEDTNGVITSSTVKIITVNSGDNSYTVAQKLADVGVVSSAQDFDTFLCQNGYDIRLRTGSFSIPANASDAQIARIITGLE